MISIARASAALRRPFSSPGCIRACSSLCGTRMQIGDRTYHLTEVTSAEKLPTYTESELGAMKGELAEMAPEHNALLASSRGHASRVTASVLFGLTGQTIGVGYLTFYTRYGWDVMEPYSYLLGACGWIACLAFFQGNKVDFTYEAFHNHFARKHFLKRATRVDFDAARWTHLNKELKRSGETPAADPSA